MGAASDFLEKLNTEKRTSELVSNMKNNPVVTNTQLTPAENFVIPNHSGRHDAGKTGTPVNDYDIANKKYVDDNAGGSPEGTSVLSTGEAGGTKYLREDGDGTCSWQSVAAGVDWTVSQAPAVIHADNYTDTNTTYTSSDFTHNNLSGVSANEHIDWTIDQGTTNIHSGNYTNTTYVSSDFTHDDLTGFVANEHIDWTIDQGATNIHSGNYTNTTYSASDFSHNSLSGLNDGDSYEHITATEKTNFGTAYTHSQDNTQAHSDYLLNNASDTTSGTITAGGFTTTGTTSLGTTTVGDHGTASTDEVINVCYGTSDPPTASTTTEGTLFIKYTA